jgi:biopolymer transport protein ExbD
MAQIEQSDKGGKKKKGAQKKMAIHVDFTPMVDMNMLLITFFMLCTTMLKSQTLQIVLPSNDKNIKDEQKNQASSKDAMTLILDTQYELKDGKYVPVKDENGNTVKNIYYYDGKSVDGEYHAQLKVENFVANENGTRQGIRAVLYKRHEEAMKVYDDLKRQWREKKISKAQFDSLAELNANDEKISHPILILKPGPNTTYESLINAIDEIKLNQITKYSIQLPDANDTILLKDYEAATGKQIIVPSVRKTNVK